MVDNSHSTPQSRQPLARALRLAATACGELAADNILYEATVTGAILGALKVAYSAFNTLGALGWAVYSQSNGSDPTSEATTGVDFGLVVITDEGIVRFATFQAKRPQNVALSKVCANRTRMVDGERVSQLVTLCSSSMTLMSDLDKPVQSSREISWVHYLAYTKTLRCVPISFLEEQLLAETQVPGSSRPIDATVVGLDFDKVLESALMEGDHWLELGDVNSKIAIPPLFKELPIAMIGSSKGLSLNKTFNLTELFSGQKPAPSSPVAQAAVAHSPRKLHSSKIRK